MTTLIKNADVRTLGLGICVTRAAALTPATGIGSIFNITGGRIAIKSLTGLVVAAMPATVNTITVGLTPTYNTTSAPAILSSAGTVTSLAAGAPITSKLDGGALIVAVNGGIMAPTPWVAVPGAVTITTSATSATGTIQWDLVYVPLDVAAQVTAA